MGIKELFNKGISYKEFINQGEKTNREKTAQIYGDIKFGEELINRIKAIDKGINVLALAEIWCPDCMVNVPVLQKIKEINNKFDFSIIKKEGNENYFDKYLIEGKVKIPTFIFFDDTFNEIGYFIERPTKVKDVYNNNNQVEVIVTTRKYRNGDYTNDTAKDILNILGY